MEEAIHTLGSGGGSGIRLAIGIPNMTDEKRSSEGGRYS